jgi:hypothetical protein
VERSAFRPPPQTRRDRIATIGAEGSRRPIGSENYISELTGDPVETLLATRALGFRTFWVCIEDPDHPFEPLCAGRGNPELLRKLLGLFGIPLRDGRDTKIALSEKNQERSDVFGVIPLVDAISSDADEVQAGQLGVYCRRVKPHVGDAARGARAKAS